MYVNACWHFCLCTTYVREVTKGVRSPRTGAADGCEPPCGGWEQNSGSLDNSVPLSTEPSRQPLVWWLLDTTWRRYSLLFPCFPGWATSSRRMWVGPEKTLRQERVCPDGVKSPSSESQKPCQKLDLGLFLCSSENMSSNSSTHEKTGAWACVPVTTGM